MKNNRFGFLRSRIFVFVAVTGLLLMLFFGLPSSKPRPKETVENLPAFATSLSSNVQINLTRPASPVAVSKPSPPQAPEPPHAKPEPVAAKPEPASALKKSPVIYSVHVDLPPETNPPPPAPKAPFGRLLQCQLVNTLESLTPNTPIIGLVVEDLWFGGKLVVPAGSEIHGQAQLDRTRERITSANNWHVVYQTGQELAVTGIALDREFDPKGSGWGITDGSAGIRGDILRNDSLDEVKLFLSTALSGLAMGMRQTQNTLLGQQIPGTAENAALSGASAVMNKYAERILEAIKRDGIYVRVPAGKQFYVYVTEPLKRAEADSSQTGPTNPPTVATRRK